MSLRFILLILCLAGGAMLAQEGVKSGRMLSAFEAVGLLSPEEQAALARIVGREGSPNPERWHLLIYDAAGEAGLREFTAAEGKILGSHPVSQFAQSLTPADVFAPKSLLFDSVHVARIAQEYCKTNGVSAASMNFDLRKSGPEAVALWTVVCLNALGEELGRIVVTAGNGTVVYHPGFTAEPLPEQLLDRPRPPPLSNTPSEIASTRNRVDPGISSVPPKKLKPAPATPAPKANFFQRVFGR